MSFQEKELNYPSVGQSWGIIGLALISMLVFAPVLLLEKMVGKELVFFLYYVLSMGAVFLLAHFNRKSRLGVGKYDFSISNLKLVALVSVAIIAIQIGIVSPLANLLPMPDAFKQMFIEFGNQKGIFAFLSIVVAAPILEELIFRGIILDGFLRRYSPVKSVVLSSFLFGIVHFNPWQFIAAFLIGLFAGWVYYKTRKLSLAIIIHAVNNLIAYLFGYFQDAEEAMSESFVESYGGITNMVLIIAGGVLVSVACVYLLKKQFAIITNDKRQGTNDDAVGVTNSVVDKDAAAE